MASERVNNLKNLSKNKTAVRMIGATAVILVGGFALAIFQNSNTAQRPADLQASVNVGGAPQINAVPGTSDSARYNELVQEANRKAAEEAAKNGTSALPRLTNTVDQNQKNPFELVQPGGTAAQPQQGVDLNIATPPVPQQPEAPQQQNQAPQQPQRAEKSDELMRKEKSMADAIGALIGGWKPVGQNIETNYTGKGGALGGAGMAGGSNAAGAGQQVGSNGSSGGDSGAAAGVQEQQKVAAIKAGSLLSAVVMTSVNSDEPGPVLAQIVSGPYAGARIMGGFSNPKDAEKLILQFTIMTIPGAPTSYPIQAYAVEPLSARTALASDVDNHYLYRYGSLMGAAFLKGYSEAISQSGATQTQSLGVGGTSSTTTYPTLDSKEKALVALGEVGTALGEAWSENFQRPATITINSGTPIGILFMGDAALGNGK